MAISLPAGCPARDGVLEAYTEDSPERRHMRKQILCLVGVLSILGTAASVSAGDLSVKIADGRATIIAKDVPVRQILAEWAKVGDTKLVNAERVAGGPVTL